MAGDHPGGFLADGPNAIDDFIEKSTGTLDAFREHGQPRQSLTENVDAAKKTMEATAQLGISMKEVTDKLTEDGVRLFSEAFDKLLKAIEKNT